MNLGELIALARSPAHLDDTVVPPLWSDEVLTTLFNDAVRQHCIRTRSLVESQDVKICRYSLAAGANSVRLHPSVLAVRVARLTFADGSRVDEMVGKTLRWVSRRCPHWETRDAGRPRYWIPDWQQGYLAFDRPMPADATLTITAWRLPTGLEQLDPADMDGEPVVAEHMRQDLIDWVVYLAMSGNDVELRNDQKASTAAAAFEAKTGRMPSAIEIRLWGVSPIVGTTPQYL